MNYCQFVTRKNINLIKSDLVEIRSFNGRVKLSMVGPLAKREVSSKYCLLLI